MSDFEKAFLVFFDVLSSQEFTGEAAMGRIDSLGKIIEAVESGSWHLEES
jgi:hypothetical protein